MTYTKTNWSDGDAITAAKLNNMELQYDNAKTDFGAVNVTVTVAVQGSSIHAVGADYLVPVGSTTAQTIINTAIAAAVAAGGGEVLLLEGTYVCSDVINLSSNITLSGMGANTIIKFTDSLSVSKNLIQNTTLTVPGNKNMIIKDLTLDGNRTKQSAGTMVGIGMQNCTDTTGRNIIRNVFIKNFRSYGIWFGTMKNIIVDKVVISGCDNGLYGGSSTLQVSNSTFTTGVVGILLYGGSDSVVSSCDCFSNTQTGVALTNSCLRTAITGCTLYNNTQNGLYISGSSYTTISGNTFRNNGTAGCNVVSSSLYTNIVGNSAYKNNQGIIVTSSSHYCAIACNTVSYSSGYGILASAAGLDISSNAVYMSGGPGIYLNGSTHCVVAGNNVYASSQNSNGTYANITLASNSHYNSVTGNLCYKGGGPAYPNYGIWIGAGCTANLVTANNLKNGGNSAAIQDSGTSTDKTSWIAAGNKVA